MLEHARARILIFKHAQARSMLDFFILDATLPTILARRLLAAVMKLWRKSNLKGNSHYAKKNLTHRHDMEVFHGFVTRP